MKQHFTWTTVFRIPQRGAVLLYDGPEQRWEAELVTRRWKSLPRHEGTKRRGLKVEGPRWQVGARVLVPVVQRSWRTKRRKDVAFRAWGDDVLLVFCPHFLLLSHFAVLWSFLHADVSWALLTFTELCSSVLEPNLDKDEQNSFIISVLYKDLKNKNFKAKQNNISAQNHSEFKV